MEYDVAVIYTGNSTDFQCRQCSHVFRMQGLKWGLIRRLALLPEWADMAAQYKYIWVADDDLRMNPCSINAFFRIMEQVGSLACLPGSDIHVLWESCCN